jgi:hypothetical protein
MACEELPNPTGSLTLKIWITSEELSNPMGSPILKMWICGKLTPNMWTEINAVFICLHCFQSDHLIFSHSDCGGV